jgi:hypothetical protein
VSKFAGLFDEPKQPAKKRTPQKSPAKAAVSAREPKAEERTGRAPGKRSDPDYTQITAFSGRRIYPTSRRNWRRPGLI